MNIALFHLKIPLETTEVAGGSPFPMGGNRSTGNLALR